MSVIIGELNERAKKVKAIVAAQSDFGLNTDPQEFMSKPIEGETSTEYSTLGRVVNSDLPTFVQRLEAMRQGRDRSVGGPVDITFAEAVKHQWGFGDLDSFYRYGVGIDMSRTTVADMMTSPAFNKGYRWLLPEIILQAIRTGFEGPSLYQSLTAQEVSLTQPEARFPIINMADAMPAVIGEGDTLPTGQLSFGQKMVHTFKLGTALRVTDEVKNYVSLDVLQIYMADMAIHLQRAMDALAIYVLLNGNEIGEECPTIGVTTPNQFKYRDLLRVWGRFARMGRRADVILADEETGHDLMEIKEFFGFEGSTTKGSLNLRTNVPTSADLLLNSNIDPSLILLADTSKSLIKLNVEALNVESQRIVENGIDVVVARMRTGFAKTFQDASVLVSKDIQYNPVAGQVGGFPEYMNPAKYEKSVFKGRSVF